MTDEQAKRAPGLIEQTGHRPSGGILRSIQGCEMDEEITAARSAGDYGRACWLEGLASPATDEPRKPTGVGPLGRAGVRVGGTPAGDHEREFVGSPYIVGDPRREGPQVMRPDSAEVRFFAFGMALFAFVGFFVGLIVARLLSP